MGQSVARSDLFLLNSEPTTHTEEQQLADDRGLRFANLAIWSYVLADAQVRYVNGAIRCAECGTEQSRNPGRDYFGNRKHTSSCRVGQVLEALAKVYTVDVERPAGQIDELAAVEQICQELAYTEPWSYSGSQLEVNADRFEIREVTTDEDLEEPLELEHFLPGSARRIAACVNFCQGLTTTALEGSKPLVEYAGVAEEIGGRQ
jgi:hypothetical protein